MAWRKDANSARHPLNAMLYYVYGVLLAKVHAAIVKAGYDPTIGVAHRRHTDPIPLAYDLMEPLRPVGDGKVLEFALANTFGPGDFTISSNGGCRLNPQMARPVARQIREIETNSVDAFMCRQNK
jgi:CRISPR-associated protein Cas1